MLTFANKMHWFSGTNDRINNVLRSENLSSHHDLINHSRDFLFTALSHLFRKSSKDAYCQFCCLSCWINSHISNPIPLIHKNHNLIFILRKTKTQYGKQKLLLKSELIEARANAIIFSIITQGKTNTHSLHLIQLKGKWRTSKFNRLQFLIQKSNNTSNTLTLQGIWEVRQNNLMYIYRKDSLITKNKNTHILRFNGYWKINHCQITFFTEITKEDFDNFKKENGDN